MKSIVKKLMASMFLLAVTGASLYAQGPPAGTGGLANVQVGQQITCNTIPSPISINVNGRDFAGLSSGSATFQVTAVTLSNPDDPRSAVTSATWTPVAVQATSRFDGLGIIQTSLSLDPAAQVTSSVTAIGDQPFPVRPSMSFNATGSLNGVPFTSTTPVTIASDAANSFLPFQNEPFRLEAPVTFAGDDGEVGFTLTQFNPIFNN
jgi:hypothetical protein